MMTDPGAAVEAGDSGQVSDIYILRLQTWLCQRFGIANP
jgi:hypothetical protein